MRTIFVLIIILFSVITSQVWAVIDESQVTPTIANEYHGTALPIAVVLIKADGTPLSINCIPVKDPLIISQIRDICPSGDCGNDPEAARRVAAILLPLDQDMTWGGIKYRYLEEWCETHPRDPACKGAGS